MSQSKKLAKILPLESADMWWSVYGHNGGKIINGEHRLRFNICDDTDIPAWSLTALLSVLPNNKHITTTLSRGGWKIEPVEYIDKWFCEYEDEVDEDSPCRGFTVSADNLIDACYEMILKLNELKML